MAAMKAMTMKAVFVDLQTTGPRDPLRDERSGKTDALADSAHTRSDVWSVSDRRRSSHRGFVFSVGTHLWVSSCTTPHTPLASTEAARRPPPPQTPPRRAQKAAGQRGLTAASCALATAAPAGRGTSSATAARCRREPRTPGRHPSTVHTPPPAASWLRSVSTSVCSSSAVGCQVLYRYSFASTFTLQIYSTQPFLKNHISHYVESRNQEVSKGFVWGVV